MLLYAHRSGNAPKTAADDVAEKKIAVALRCHHQRARASSSGCCPSGGDKQRGCRRAGRCRISSTRYDATPRAIVSSIESRTNGLVQENVWTSWLHGTHVKIQLPVIMLHLCNEKYKQKYFIELRAVALLLTQIEQFFR